MLKKIFSMLVIVSLAALCVAEEKKENKEKKEDEIQVREYIEVKSPALIDGIKISNMAEKVTKVSSEQIEAMNGSDIASVMYKVPGIVMSRQNMIGAFGGGEGGALFIRGHGASRPGQEIATMVDGIPRFSGIWTHSLLDMLPVDPVGSIEVYKNPQPVMHGNMSYAGINIIQKQPQESGSLFRIRSQFGSFNTFTLNSDYSYSNNSVGILVGGGRRSSEGHRPDSDGDVTTGYLNAQYKISNNFNISALFNYSESDVNDPGDINAAPKPIIENFKTESTFSILKATHSHNWGTGSLKFYVDDGYQDWLQWSGSKSEEFNSITDFTNYGIRFRENLDIIQNAEFILGFDYDSIGGDFTEDHPGTAETPVSLSMYNAAPYGALSYTIIAGKTTLTASTGIRVNYNEVFETETGYQAGLRVTIPGVVFYGNYSHSFNLPGLFTAILFGGGPTGEEWKSLESELIEHYETGFQAAPFKWLNLGVSYFADDVENALRVTFPGPAYANIGNYNTSGVEFEINSSTRYFDLFVGGAFLESDDEQIPYLPDFSLSSGLNIYPFSGFTANIIFQHIGEHYTGNPRTPAPSVPVEGFSLVSFHMSYDFSNLLNLQKNVEIFCHIDNLLDEEYELRPGYPMPGINGFLGFKLAF